MPILELFASVGFDEAQSLSEVKDAAASIAEGEALALVFAGREIEDPNYVHWALEWPSLRARDVSMQDGSYQRLMKAVGSSIRRGPIVTSLLDDQIKPFSGILDTPVPEFAVTKVKGRAARAQAAQAIDGMLANPHERTTQGEVVLRGIDDEDCVIFVAGWKSVEDHMSELSKPSQKAVNDLAESCMEVVYIGHCSGRIL
ncbi:hypothetical protein BD626DRAFT_515594, partial [Schizophyllum amplum]